MPPLSTDNRPVPQDLDVPLPRRITALIARDRHVEGADADNFEADAEALLADETLEERDRKFLRFALRHCLCDGQDGDHQRSVVLTGRQFSTFVDIRRRYNETRRERHRALIRSIFNKSTEKSS